MLHVGDLSAEFGKAGRYVTRGRCMTHVERTWSASANAPGAIERCILSPSACRHLQFSLEASHRSVLFHEQVVHGHAEPAAVDTSDSEAGAGIQASGGIAQAHLNESALQDCPRAASARPSMRRVPMP